VLVRSHRCTPRSYCNTSTDARRKWSRVVAKDGSKPRHAVSRMAALWGVAVLSLSSGPTDGSGALMASHGGLSPPSGAVIMWYDQNASAYADIAAEVRATPFQREFTGTAHALCSPQPTQQASAHHFRLINASQRPTASTSL
jgi:hypothetical protein